MRTFPPRYLVHLFMVGGALMGCTYRTELDALGSGGTTAEGGTASTNTSTSPVDERWCASDSDCTECLYAKAPSDPTRCADALGCCGGPIINKTTCAKNSAAWKANCAGRDFTADHCGWCWAECGRDTKPSCANGKCGVDWVDCP